LLQYKGESLLRHVISEAVSSDAKPVIVVLGTNADLMSEEINNSNVSLIFNMEWEEGMASSIRVGLNAILEISPSVDAVIIMVCDQPFVSAFLLNDLINTQMKTGKRIVTSDYGEAIGPPVLFQKDIFPELMKLKGDAGAKKIIQKHSDDVATVLFSKGSIDIDTKEDYEALKNP